MENTVFTSWCQKATEKIRYGPDRRVVSRELMGHLEDHRDALMEQGLTREEAERKALEAMGSAKEIAPQLAALHKPWLGYLSSLIKAAAIMAAALALLCSFATGGSFLSALSSTRDFDSIPVNHGPLDYYCRPNVSDSANGYHFQVTEAGYRKAASILYFELEMIYWPWIDAGDIAQHFWAVDNFGNYYHAMAEEKYESPNRISRSGAHASSLICTYHMQINDFDVEAQWVELHYDRDGRDIVLRIDLTGGGEDG